jgi:hypothetical protein
MAAPPAGCPAATGAAEFLAFIGCRSVAFRTNARSVAKAVNLMHLQQL